MKHISLVVCLILAAAFSSVAQAPDPKDEREQVAVLVKEVATQQSQIAANQAKIDAQLIEVAEAVRVARIFSSRSK